MKSLIVVAILLALLSLYACRSTNPIQRAEQVDIDAFMGDWYVIANIPTFIEKGAHNAVESYQRESQDKVATTFRFNEDAFTGEEKVYNPTGFIQDESNAYWKMRFVWPFKSEYVISYVDEDYQYTIIGRSKRDYVWIMAREPVIDEAILTNLIERAVAMGYSRQDIQRVPQQELGQR